jgi:hypothetical protein
MERTYHEDECGLEYTLYKSSKVGVSLLGGLGFSKYCSIALG